MRISIFHCCFLLFCVAARSQYCGSITYNTDDGLGAGLYTDIFQDKAGYLWVGSYNNGVNRFDGKQWVRFGQGLKSDRVSNIFEDKEGGLWFFHDDYGATRFFKGKYWHFSSLAEAEKHKAGQPGFMPFGGWLTFDPAAGIPKVFIWDDQEQLGRLYFFDFSSNTFRDSGQSLPPGGAPSGGRRMRLCFDLTGRQVLELSSSPSFQTDLTLFDGKQFHDLPPLPVRKKWGDAYFNWHLHLSFNSPDEGLRCFAIAEKGISSLEKNAWRLLPPPAPERYGSGAAPPRMDLYNVYFDREYRALYSTWKIYGDEYHAQSPWLLAEHDPFSLRVKKTLVFSSFSPPTCVKKDRAGSYWVSTEAKVLRLFSDRYLVPSNAPGMPAKTWCVAQAPDNKIWLASYGEGLAAFDGWQLSPPPPSVAHFTLFNDGSQTDEAGNLLFNVGEKSGAPENLGILKFDGKNRWSRLPAINIQGFYLSHDKKGRLTWGTHEHGLWILPTGKTGVDTADWLKINRSKGLKLYNVITCLEDRYGRYWMGRPNQGAALYDPETDRVFNWMKEDDPANYGVMSLAEDAKGNLWFGTDKGLCFLENRPGIDQNFDLRHALQPVGQEYTGASLVNVCKLYDERTLVFGNDIGYFLLDLEAWYAQPRRLRLQSFTQKTGNPGGSVNQNGVWVDRSRKVWLTCANGVMRFDPAAVAKDTIPPFVRIDSLNVGGKVLTRWGERLRLKNHQRNLRIHFSHPFNPMLIDNVRFQYRLSRHDQAWSALQENDFVDFSNLSSGEHLFEVRAVKEGMLSEPAQVRFRIAPFWWQNPAAWLVIIGGVILIAAFLQRHERQIHAQQLQLEKAKTDMEKMNKEKDKLHVQAIVNQLNPHFINNTLQWLQVRLDEDAEAVSVVGKLSENISAIFKNSRNKKAFHSLRAELKLTENYLFIQKSRFRDKLSYELPTEEAILKAKQVNVPLMMVQIHVENAIEHGIRNKPDGRGKVRVALREEGEYVVLTIEDDGVGREAAKKIGSKSTQQGTKMLQELQDIYNRQNSLPIRQTYQDNIFVNEEGRRHGTRVELRVPKNYNYEI